MTKAAAIQAFLEAHGPPAYDVASVPSDVAFPYQTYTLATGAFGDGDIAITVEQWHYTAGDVTPNAVAQQLSEAIGLGGVALPCDGGLIWLKRGSPFSQSLKDESNDMIKRRYINISAEYITAD
jgi:hypothetical protein